jgi:hypothetical protein
MPVGIQRLSAKVYMPYWHTAAFRTIVHALLAYSGLPHLYLHALLASSGIPQLQRLSAQRQRLSAKQQRLSANSLTKVCEACSPEHAWAATLHRGCPRRWRSTAKCPFSGFPHLSAAFRTFQRLSALSSGFPRLSAAFRNEFQWHSSGFPHPSMSSWHTAAFRTSFMPSWHTAAFRT